MINDINYLMARTELANIVRDPNSFPPFATKGRPEGIEVFLTGRARRLHPQVGQEWLKSPPITNETVYWESLPLETIQLMGSLQKCDPNFDEGCQILTVGLDTFRCYQAWGGSGWGGLGTRCFCLIDVVLGVLELFSWVPGINRFADGLTIVHFAWKQGGKLHERVFKGSAPEAKPLMKLLRSQPKPAK
jgi:hypothetical protein